MLINDNLISLYKIDDEYHLRNAARTSFILKRKWSSRVISHAFGGIGI